MIIPKINYLTWNLKEKIEKEKEKKENKEEENEEKEKKKKKKIKLRQEWNLIEKWKKNDKILTKMMKMKQNREMGKGKNQIIWKYIINYFGWKIPMKERRKAKNKEQKEKIIENIIENEKVRNINNKIKEYPIEWINRAYMIPIEIKEKDIKEEKIKNNKIQKEEYSEKKEIKIDRNMNINRTKLITNINKLINKKTIEYISKTKNIYGSIIYLKNYWKYIINSYFPKEKRNIGRDISKNLTNKEKSILSTNKDANRLKEKGNRKCIIKKRLLEQKAIEIIERERPLIGIYRKIKKRKEKRIKGKKKKNRIDIKGKRDIQKIKQTEIMKTEIMFTNVIKIMENIKWK